MELEKKRVWIAGRYWFKDPPATSTTNNNTDQVDICCQCQLVIQDSDCYSFQHLQWHPSCFQCSKCKTLLDETKALLLENVLYCQSCCELDATSPSIAQCRHVSLLQHNLNHLKAYLAKMSTTTAASSPVTANNLNGGNNQINSDLCISN